MKKRHKKPKFDSNNSFFGQEDAIQHGTGKPDTTTYDTGGSVGGALGGVLGTALAPLTGGLSAAFLPTFGNLVGNMIDGASKKSHNNKLLNRPPIQDPVINENPYGTMKRGGKVSKKKTRMMGDGGGIPPTPKPGQPYMSYKKELTPLLKYKKTLTKLDKGTPPPVAHIMEDGGIVDNYGHPISEDDILMFNMGDGGGTPLPTVQPASIEPWQKAYYQHPAMFRKNIFGKINGNLSWYPNNQEGFNMLANDAEAFDQDTRLQREHMRAPHPQFGGGGKHWIQGAINPAHKGYCTPMSKSTCIGRRRALALTFKKHHGFHKKEDGGLAGPFDEMDQYCMGGMKMDDGGMAPQSSVIDVEKGEVRVGPDQQGRSVIKEKYNNPNKFQPHAKNPMHEPVGNFVEAPSGDIIISKNMVNTYTQGDDITRKSIERNLVQRQAKEKPEQLGIQRSKKGGIVVRKYSGGGLSPMGIPYEDMNYLPTDMGPLGGPSYGLSPLETRPVNPNPDNIMLRPIQDQEPFDYNQFLGIDPRKASYIPPTGTDFGIPNGKTSDHSIINDFTNSLSGTNLERAAPIAADAYQFLGATSYDTPNRLRNTGNATARRNLNALETNVNVDPQLQQINRSRRAQLNSVRDLNVGATVQNAQNNQVGANTLAQENDVMGAKVNREQDLRNAKRNAIASFEVNAGAQDAAYQGQFDEQLAQNKSAAQNIRNASVADVGSKFSQFGAEDKYFNVIKDSLKDYFDFSGFNKNNFSGAFKDNPDLINRVVNSVQFNSLDDASKWQLYSQLTQTTK